MKNLPRIQVLKLALMPFLAYKTTLKHTKTGVGNIFSGVWKIYSGIRNTKAWRANIFTRVGTSQKRVPNIFIPVRNVQTLVSIILTTVRIVLKRISLVLTTAQGFQTIVRESREGILGSQIWQYKLKTPEKMFYTSAFLFEERFSAL